MIPLKYHKSHGYLTIIITYIIYMLSTNCYAKLLYMLSANYYALNLQDPSKTLQYFI